VTAPGDHLVAALEDLLRRVDALDHFSPDVYKMKLDLDGNWVHAEFVKEAIRNTSPTTASNGREVELSPDGSKVIEKDIVATIPHRERLWPDGCRTTVESTAEHHARFHEQIARAARDRSPDHD
jgi:hypothetical protein